MASTEYDTKLTPEEEQKFQTWAAQQSQKMGRDVLMDTEDYDLRGLWKENGGFGANGHAPDTYKKPNHPTFSDQSKYSNEQTPGGKWSQDDKGQWTFTPSEQNLRAWGPENLKRYFAEREPNAKLVLPEKKQQLYSDMEDTKQGGI